jgi:hypothetical protein
VHRPTAVHEARPEEVEDVPVRVAYPQVPYGQGRDVGSALSHFTCLQTYTALNDIISADNDDLSSTFEVC